MTKNPLDRVIEAIRKIDPAASGTLSVGEVHDKVISGTLNTTFKTVKDLEEDLKLPAGYQFGDEFYVKSPTLTVFDRAPRSDSEANDSDDRVFVSEDEDRLAQVREVHTPESVTTVHVDQIIGHNSLKRNNPEAEKKLISLVKDTRFITPVILNEKLEIIDGSLRVKAAKANQIFHIPAIIIQASPKLTKFLRIVLNRSSEFQRWDFTQVDEFADANLALTGYLEPYGIFASEVIPETFLGETVKNYEISEHNEQQQFYTQSIGLAEWARRKREEDQAKQLAKEKRQKAAAAKKAKEVREKKTMEAGHSLFDVFANEDVPVETSTNPVKEIEQTVINGRKVAGVITENYDEHRGEAAERQGKRRSSKTKTAENKLAASQVDVDDEQEANEPEDGDDD